MKRLTLSSLYLLSCVVMMIGSAFAIDPSIEEGDKVIPQSVEAAAREALSYYPELQDIPIEFEFKDDMGHSFMQAQPRVGSLFNDKENRKYVIKMTREMIIDDEYIPVSEIPHKVLVGWFAHELGHVMDYLNRSSSELVWFGTKYWVSDKFKSVAERNADIFAIKHGLSEEIIATKKFILKNSSLPEEYVAKIKRLYLSPANVLEIVQKLEEEKEEGDLDHDKAHEEIVEEKT